MMTDNSLVHGEQTGNMDMPWYWSRVPHPSSDSGICTVSMMTEEEREHMEDECRRKGILPKDKRQAIQEAERLRKAFQRCRMKKNKSSEDLEDEKS